MNLYSSSHFRFNQFGVTEGAARRGASASAPYRTTGSKISGKFKQSLPPPVRDTPAGIKVEEIITKRSIKDLVRAGGLPFDINTLQTVYGSEYDDRDDDDGEYDDDEEKDDNEVTPDLVPDILRGFVEELKFEKNSAHKYLDRLIDLFYHMPQSTSEAIVKSLGREIKEAQAYAIFCYLLDSDVGEVMLYQPSKFMRKIQKRRQQREEKQHSLLEKRRAKEAAERAYKLKLRDTTGLDGLMAQMTLGAGAGASLGEDDEGNEEELRFGSRRKRKSGSNKRASSFGRRRRTNRSGSKKKNKSKNARR